MAPTTSTSSSLKPTPSPSEATTINVTNSDVLSGLKVNEDGKRVKEVIVGAWLSSFLTLKLTVLEVEFAGVAESVNVTVLDSPVLVNP